MKWILSLSTLCTIASLLAGCNVVRPHQPSSVCGSEKAAIQNATLNHQPGSSNPAERASMIDRYKDFGCK